jgi:hypothetical protein
LERSRIPLQGRSFWESSPPMGPPENPSGENEKQAAQGRKRPGGRPRARLCLLKGCERHFHPEHTCQRYCSQRCREAARAWSEWKARRAYRATAAGKQKRKHQSQRYRKGVQERKTPEKAPVAEPARVIPKELFFRWLLPAAGLLRVFPALAAVATATVLLACLPACHGTGLGTRAALAQTAWLAVPPRRAEACAAAMNAKD